MLLYDFQKKVTELLLANAELNGIIKDFGDTITKETPLPYVIIGEDEETSKGTKVNRGCQINSNIEVWSDYPTFKECKNLVEIIEGIFNSADMDLDTFHCINFKMETDSFADATNEVKRAIIQLQIEYLEY